MTTTRRTSKHKPYHTHFGRAKNGFLTSGVQTAFMRRMTAELEMNLKTVVAVKRRKSA